MMAIVVCSECGNKISDSAEICPHSGLPRRFFNLPNSDTIVELPEFMGYENKQADKVGKLYDDYFTSKPLRELTVTDHIKIK